MGSEKMENSELLVKLWNGENRLLAYRTLGLLVVNSLLLLSFTGAQWRSVLSLFILFVGLGLGGLWIYLGTSGWCVLRSIYQRLAKEESFAKLWDGGKVVYCYLMPIGATAIWLVALIILLFNITIGG